MDEPTAAIQQRKQDNDGEPRLYVYLVDDVMRVGTLADYARAWELGQYSDASVSGEVRTWTDSYQVNVEHLGADDNDYMQYRLVVPGECVLVNVDGRA